MAVFFHGESHIKKPSSDLFVMNLNPFSEPTTTTNAHNHHFYNLCFGSQQHGPRDEVDYIEQGNSSISMLSNGGVFRALAPIYLRAAYELLNEIVCVGNGSHDAEQERRMSKESAIYGNEDISSGQNPGPAACRQELEMKKVKLIAMVEKVEQRYKQYHDQMQTIISSFEQAAGLGSAKPYTHMALQTVSKQFCNVNDMICLQIKHMNKLLEKKKYDEQLKHLGKITHHHPNVWKPERGLPEKAVSVLRSWLFEHFLHPYPRDLDKVMLAKQTGLTKNQVSNWFINARVRVWKPMVEELYWEEMAFEEIKKGNNQKEHTIEGSTSKQPCNNTISDESTNSILLASHQELTENKNPMQNSSSSCSVVKFGKQHINQANFIHINGGFENYHTMVGNSVSLSLGLPHFCEQTFNNIQFLSTSHGTEISGIYPSSTYQTMD